MSLSSHELTLRLLCQNNDTPEFVRERAEAGDLRVDYKPISLVRELHKWVIEERHWLGLSGGFGSGKSTALYYFGAYCQALWVIERVSNERVQHEHWVAVERPRLLAEGEPKRKSVADFPEILDEYGPDERARRVEDQYRRDLRMWERLNREPEPFDEQRSLEKYIHADFAFHVYRGDDILEMAWDDKHWIDRFNPRGRRFLALDDFGREHFREAMDDKTSWGREQWEILFDHLYQYHVPLLFATNDKPAELRARYKDMIFDRIRGRGRILGVGEQSFRKPPELPAGIS